MKPYALICSLCFFMQSLSAQKIPATISNKPFVLGSIAELQSEVLAEKRVLNIYFPPGYEKNDSTKYPVIYVLDGSADEDFIHLTGLVQFFNFPWVNVLPEAIVVGIANVDRRRDFTFPTTIVKDKNDFPTTGSSAKFIRFLEDELQPYVEKNYRAGKDRTVIGQSLGGLLATEILFTKPGLFNTYIIVSPSLWWNNESLLALQPAPLPAKTIRPAVFIAAGEEGKRMAADTRRLTTILKAVHGDKLTLHFRQITGEDHASTLHIAVYRALIQLHADQKKRQAAK